MVQTKLAPSPPPIPSSLSLSFRRLKAFFPPPSSSLLFPLFFRLFVAEPRAYVSRCVSRCFVSTVCRAAYGTMERRAEAGCNSSADVSYYSSVAAMRKERGSHEKWGEWRGEKNGWKGWGMNRCHGLTDETTTTTTTITSIHHIRPCRVVDPHLTRFFVLSIYEIARVNSRLSPFFSLSYSAYKYCLSNTQNGWELDREDDSKKWHDVTSNKLIVRRSFEDRSCDWIINKGGDRKFKCWTWKLNSLRIRNGKKRERENRAYRISPRKISHRPLI